MAGTGCAAEALGKIEAGLERAGKPLIKHLPEIEKMEWARGKHWKPPKYKAK